MASDFRQLREQVLARFPILRSTAFERRMLFQPDRHSLDPAVISSLRSASVA
jgi:hypothetical protein